MYQCVHVCKNVLVALVESLVIGFCRRDCYGSPSLLVYSTKLRNHVRRQHVTCPGNRRLLHLAQAPASVCVSSLVAVHRRQQWHHVRIGKASVMGVSQVFHTCWTPQTIQSCMRTSRVHGASSQPMASSPAMSLAHAVGSAKATGSAQAVQSLQATGSTQPARSTQPAMSSKYRRRPRGSARRRPPPGAPARGPGRQVRRPRRGRGPPPRLAAARGAPRGAVRHRRSPVRGGCLGGADAATTLRGQHGAEGRGGAGRIHHRSTTYAPQIHTGNLRYAPRIHSGAAPDPAEFHSRCPGSTPKRARLDPRISIAGVRSGRPCVLGSTCD